MNRFSIYLFCFSLLWITALAAQTDSWDILFFSNINGVVKNCGCGNPALGGLARIITKVKQERKQNPKIVVLDGGDYYNSYSYPEIDQAVSEMYHLLQPDIIVPGEQEMIEGLSFFKQTLLAVSTHYLASNMHVPGVKFSDSYVLSPKIVLNSFLDVSAFDIIRKPAELQLDDENFKHIYRTAGKRKILITVFHGSEKALISFIKTYPRINIVLLAHAQSDRVELNSVPIIIGGGTDGEYLKRIHIVIRENKPHVTVKKIPIKLNILPNTKALDIIQKWNIL